MKSWVETYPELDCPYPSLSDVWEITIGGIVNGWVIYWMEYRITGFIDDRLIAVDRFGVNCYLYKDGKVAYETSTVTKETWRG